MQVLLRKSYYTDMIHISLKNAPTKYWANTHPRFSVTISQFGYCCGVVEISSHCLKTSLFFREMITKKLLAQCTMKQIESLLSCLTLCLCIFCVLFLWHLTWLCLLQHPGVSALTQPQEVVPCGPECENTTCRCAHSITLKVSTQCLAVAVHTPSLSR